MDPNEYRNTKYKIIIPYDVGFDVLKAVSDGKEACLLVCDFI
jgi:hypothetical protein